MSRAKADDAPAGGNQRWVVTWADVEQAQLESMLRATPEQRLAWLEEAMRLAYASGALGADCGPHNAPDRSAVASPPQRTNSGSRPFEEGDEANYGTESPSGDRR